MEVRVLGKSPSWQDGGGACSGYLIREDGFSLLLDCGSGVFAKLREELDYLDVDAILISHLHPDHVLDLVPFSFALRYSPRRLPANGSPPPEPARPALHAPPGAAALFRRLAGCWGDERQFEQAFDLDEYRAGDALKIGPLGVRFCEVPHFTQSFASELSTPGGRRFTFGADCGPSDDLVGFATGTDLLMLEATQAEVEPGEMRGHMTAREAGELARRADAAQVVITHFSDELDVERIRREASSAFGRDVHMAHEGAVFTL